MPTPRMWKAMDRYERYFLLNWNCPFRRNAKAGKFEYNGNLWTLKGWVLAQFTTILNLSALVGFLGVCNFSKSCSFSLTELIIIGALTALALLTISFDAVVLLYSEDAILAFNQLEEIQSLVMIRGNCCGGGQEKLDVVEMFYKGITIMFAIYPYFLTFFGIIFNLDPLYYAARELQLIAFFHSHFFLHLTFILMRVMLAYPTIIQGCRLYPIIAIVGGIFFRLVTDAVSVLKAGAAAISLEWRTQNILQIHSALEIIFKMVHPFVGSVALVSMGTGLVFDVLFNYATLKLHGTIPMPLYLYFPSASIIVPIMAQLLIPVAGAIAEADKKLHQEWAFHAKNSRNKKYLMRKLRCVGTLKIYAGLPGTNIFPMVSSTKGTYFRAMIDYTITALLWNYQPSE